MERVQQYFPLICHLEVGSQAVSLKDKCQIKWMRSLFFSIPLSPIIKIQSERRCGAAWPLTCSATPMRPPLVTTRIRENSIFKCQFLSEHQARFCISVMNGVMMSTQLCHQNAIFKISILHSRLTYKKAPHPTHQAANSSRLVRLRCPNLADLQRDE